MATDRQHGFVVFVCDECEIEFDSQQREWDEAMAAFREAGWTARMIDKEWMHACPDHPASLMWGKR